MVKQCDSERVRQSKVHSAFHASMRWPCESQRPPLTYECACDILDPPLTGGADIRADAGVFIVVGFLSTLFLLVAGSGSQSSAALPQRQAGPVVAAPPVLVDALHFDGYELQDADEAFRLINVGSTAADIGDWTVADQQSETAFPAGTILAPGQSVWCAQEAAGFTRQFGFKPDFEYGADTDASVPDMVGMLPRFNNDGDACILKDGEGKTVDALVYRAGDTPVEGWDGPAVEPWTSGYTFAAEGQVLYRKRDQATGLPVPDTGTASDWAQDPGDPIDGRKVLYPGWDLDTFFFTERITETATLTVAVAPDNLYETLVPVLANAQNSIQIASYSFRSRELADLLLDRLQQGVEVTLLLEGAPAFDGVTDEERWIVAQLRDAGATILFMVNDSDERVHDRYMYHHAKYLIVDGNTVLLGSENMNPSSMPADDKTNGTAGRRGVYLITDSQGVVQRVQAVFAVDADPQNHADVVGCDSKPDLCTPPAGFEPDWTPDWMTYTVRFPQPFSASAEMAFEVIHSPDNSLRDRDGLLGLLGRAGSGDTILVEQFYEHLTWGPPASASDAVDACASEANPRLEAYLAAARRGATVRVLLDRYFDRDGGNAAVVSFLSGVARKEGLDLEANRGNPTRLGLHNKMVLARIDGKGYVHAGSINGNEVSSKANRELALQVQSDGAYEYLRAVFQYDWDLSRPRSVLPFVARGYRRPWLPGYPLITEVYYRSIPEKEWVELYNPTLQRFDLSDYKLGDAARRRDAEAMYQFPPRTHIDPGQVLVVAARARNFVEDNPGHTPDFEMMASDPAVPDMRRYGKWGTWEWGLNNSGDEILLLDGDDKPVDVVVYGQGSFPGVVPHPGEIWSGHSLEREPAGLDSDDCRADFRDQPAPSPGRVPQPEDSP